MDADQQPQPQEEKPSLDGLDIQKTRELLARQGVPMMTPALPDFYQGQDPVQQEPNAPTGIAAQAVTGKDVYEYFQAHRNGPNKVRFSYDEQGAKAFGMMVDYIRSRDSHLLDSASMALGQMTSEITEGINAMPNPVTDPLKAGATAAEGLARGIRDIYGVLAESEDPTSPFFKFRNYAARLLGKDDGDVYSQMRQFHLAVDFNDATYDKTSVLADLLPEGWRDHFSKYVDQKAAIGLSYVAMDLPEFILSLGSSTPMTAARLAATSGSKAARMAKGEKMYAAWAAATTDRIGSFGQRVMGNTMEAAGGAIKAPFKAIYGTSQAAAQMAGDYAGNAVRNMATAEIVEAGVQMTGMGPTNPAIGFFRSFGAEAMGELLQVAGQDMVDRSLGKTMVKSDSLGMTTLERLASGTAKGAESMSREAQILAKGVNAAIGWAPSLSGATLKTMFRDGMFGAALGYGNSSEEGMGAGLAMGAAWGGMTGSIRHLHSYTTYTPQDARVVDNFKDYVIPAFGRMMGPTSMEMARRFHDKVNSFGDLRTSSIELSHLSTLVAHEASLVGEGNVMFYFGNSPQEFMNVMAESNIKPQDYDKVIGAFSSLSESSAAGMFEKITLNDGSVKRLIAINSDMYRPTTARHEITHALFRSVVEANSEMDSVINKETGRYMGDVFNPSYASRIFGTSKDLGVMPDAAWQSLMISYGAAQMWTEFGKPDDPKIVSKIGEMAKAEYGELLTRIRGHLKRGVDMQNYEVVNDFIRATNMAEEAFAYYASGTSNVFAVDKYVKDPAARNLLRGWAENRAARKNSRILSSLEEAGVEIRAKFTNTDGSPKLFDDAGNPAIETFMFDDGIVVRTPAMDSWVESVLKQAYARSEVLVSTLDPFRQEAFAKEHGKTHLFAPIRNGGMKLKSPAELDEMSKDQAAKILDSINKVNEQVRPVVETGPDGSKRIKLENANAETLQAIQASGAFTPQEFNELIAIVKVAEKNRAGDVTFNVMTGTLLAHTKQVRKAGGVYRLTGSDVPVTYRTFMPYSVEVSLKTHDSEGNPLRSPKGGVLIHSVDVAAVNRRLMKTFKRPDVRALFGGNFAEFVDRFNSYVSNQSGLSGAKVPSADLFRAEFGADAEKVRDIMYEAFGGRKRKDDSFINTPADGYLGGADDPNRPFYTMRFDTLADIKVHPTSWNVHSKVQPFPYVHIQGYDGISRNFQITGFTERDMGNGRKYLKDNNGFEIYETKGGYALFDPFAIKVGVFKTATAAIKRATAAMAKVDEADKVEQSDPTINDVGHNDQTLADLEVVSDAMNRGARFHLTGVKDVVIKSMHAGKAVADHINDSIGEKVNEIGYENRPGGTETAFSQKFISLYSMLGDGAKAFDTEVEVDGTKYKIGMSDTQIVVSDPSVGYSKGTEVVGGFQNELIRIDRNWFKDLYAKDKALLQDQLSKRMAYALKVSALHKAGLIPMPTAFTKEAVSSYRAMGEVMLGGGAGSRDTRDAAISKLLEGHGKGMADLAGDIRWVMFDAGDKSKKNWSDNRPSESPNFVPNTFARGGAAITPRWETAFNSFKISSTMASDPRLKPIIEQAMAAKSPEAYAGKVGGELPLYIDITKIALGDADRDALASQLMAAGASRGAFWEFHSKASGIDDIIPALREFIAGSKLGRNESSSRNKLTRAQQLQMGEKARTPMQEGPAKEMVVGYMKSVEELAKRGGMFTKSVAGFFDSEGKLRVDAAGKKTGFVSSVAMMDINDPDVMNVASMSNLYNALKTISEDISNDPANERHKLDYIRVMALIMRITSDESMIFHEFKSLDDRNLAPGSGEIRAKTGLLAGGHSESMDFYTLPPSVAEVVTTPPGLGGIYAYNPINVNKNTPARFAKIAEERAMHVGDSGVPAMIFGVPKYGEKYSASAIDAGGISHYVATGSQIKAFMSNVKGSAKVTTDPSSLVKTADGIIPAGATNWDGVIPALALQTFAAPGGEAKMKALIPTAQKAVEGTISSVVGWKWKGMMEAARSMARSPESVRASDITMMLKSAGAVGDNMTVLEQLMHGYIDTYSSNSDVRVAGLLRITQSLAIHENLFKAGLDADSFPVDGPAHSLLRSMDVRQTKLTPSSNKYMRMMRQFLKDGSVADVSGDYRIMERQLPGQVSQAGTTGLNVGYGVKSTDTVQQTKLMMLTGSKAIAQLDNARKDELHRLGLIGKMADGFGREFDYFEMSDAKAELNLSRFGGTRDGIITSTMPGGVAVVDRYLDMVAKSIVDGTPTFDMSAQMAIDNHIQTLNIKMSDILSHPELYAFYPQLASMPVKIRFTGDSIAAYNPENGGFFKIDANFLLEDRLSERLALTGRDEPAKWKDQLSRYFSPEARNERFRRVILHEIQHAIVNAENMIPLVYPSMIDSEILVGTAANIKEPRMAAHTIAALSPNLPVVLGGSDLAPIGGSTQSLITPGGYGDKAFFEAVDKKLIGKMDAMYASSLKLLSFSQRGMDYVIDPLDPTAIRSALSKIVDAPMSIDLMRRVVPNQKLLINKMMAKIGGAYDIISATLSEADRDSAMLRIEAMAEMLSAHEAQLDAYAQLIPKYDPAAALKASDSMFWKINDINNDTANFVEYLQGITGVDYDREFGVLKAEVTAGIKISQAKMQMNAGASSMTPESLSKLTTLVYSDLSNLLYSGDLNEFMANTTMARSRMGEAELANATFPQPQPLHQTMVALARYMDDNYNTRFFGNDAPKLMMIGGSAGSEQMNVSPFGKASENLFRGGVRMMARATLLSHYVSSVNEDIAKYGKLMFTSRGWKIGEDGMPVYVHEVGTLTGAQSALEGFGGAARNLAFNVEGAIRKKTENKGYRVFENVSETFGNFTGSERQANTNLKPIADLIEENDFMPSTEAVHSGPNGTIPFLGGLTSDGKSVTIQDVAKAMGAVVVVEDTIGYRSEVMNALYNSSRRGIPDVISAEKLVDTFKAAGVPDSDIASARLTEIQNKFRGTDLSVGELIDLVAVLHEVPIITSYKGGDSIKSVLVRMLGGSDVSTEMRKLYDYATKENGAYAEVMRSYINWVVGKQTGRNPLTSIFKARIDTAGEGASAGRFFLMDAVKNSILFDWNSSDNIARMIGKENGQKVVDRIVARLIAKYPDTNPSHSTGLENLLLKEDTLMSIGTDVSGWEAKERAKVEYLLRFTTRLEKLLMHLTPMADKLAAKLERSIKTGDMLMDNSERSDKMMKLVEEFYSSALEEGLADVLSTSALASGPDGAFQTTREIYRKLEGNRSYTSNQPHESVLKRGYGYAGDSLAAGHMVFHGLIGGANHAFKESAYIGGMMSGMVGTMLFPEGKDAYDSVSAKLLARAYPGMDFSPGSDVPASVEIRRDGTTRSVLRGIGRHTTGEPKEEISLASALSNIEGKNALRAITNQTDQPAYLLNAVAAQRVLMVKAKALLDYIAKFEGEPGIEYKMRLIKGSSSINASDLETAFSSPELLGILQGADIGPQLVKAKGLLSIAESVNQGAHNIGAGGIVALDQGFWEMPIAIDRDYAGGYKPLAQAAMVRAYTRGGAKKNFVVSSVVEALGSALSSQEALVINNLIGKDTSREGKIAASEPVRVMARTIAIGANLLSETDMYDSPVFLDYASPSYETAMEKRRMPKISRALARAAKSLEGEYDDLADNSYYIARNNYSGGGLHYVLSKGFVNDGFLRRIALSMDGTTLLAAASQILSTATEYDNNKALGAKLRQFVQKDWMPFRWDFGSDIEYASFSDQMKRDAVTLSASVAASLGAMAIPSMRYPLLSDHRLSSSASPGAFKDLMEMAKQPDGNFPDEAARDRVESMIHGAMNSMPNGMSMDAMKQLSVLTGLTFLQRQLFSKLGTQFSAKEKLAIEAAVHHAASMMDIVEGYDIDPIIVSRKLEPSADRTIPWNWGKISSGVNSISYVANKNKLQYDLFRRAVRSQMDMFSMSQYPARITGMLKDLAQVPGYKRTLKRNSMNGSYSRSEGNVRLVSGIRGDSTHGVSRGGDSGSPTMKLNPEMLEGVSEDESYTHLNTYAGKGVYSSELDGYLPVGEGVSFAGIYAMPSEYEGGVVGALFNMADPIDLIDMDPPEQPGIVQVDVGAAGKSALSESVIRAFVSDTIISQAQRAGAETIEVAPAGVQLSYGGAGTAEFSGKLSHETMDVATAQVHGRGMRTISKTSYQNIHSGRSKKPLLIHGDSGLMGFSGITTGKDDRGGTGYLGDPHRAGEFATKKGYAWKRLPDGRIMINITGDHLGYKVDDMMKRPGRVGYGFSLAEGVGYDPNTGLIIPSNLYSQIVTADYLEAFGHPMAAAFTQKDPAMMQAYIDAALRDKRGYHPTRGKIPDTMQILEKLSTSISGRMGTDVFKEFISDRNIALERRASHAASINEVMAPSSYTTLILPAGMKTEDLAAVLMSIHADPLVGAAIVDGSKRDRGQRAVFEFQLGDHFSGDRNQRGTYRGAYTGKTVIPHASTGPYSRGALVGLKDSVNVAVSQDGHLWSDVYAAASRMLSQDGGYFLPDTERTLSMNGDTGLAITKLFPGRPDLLANAWDTKAGHGIKVWKRTGPKDDPNFRAYVVELNQPSAIAPEGGLVIGKKAVAFKTEAEAIAYSNKVATHATSASTIRALAGNDFRIVDRPKEGGSDKFAPDASVSEIQRVTPQTGRAFQEALEGTGLYRVGDLDEAMSIADARKLGKALGRNAHIEFDTPPVQLRQITGKTMGELESVVRQKLNFGLPQGAMNFASKAMNAIMRGLPPNNRDFTHLTGSDWMNLLKKNGVSKDEIRQTGLGHLLLNSAAVKLSRQDLAEFLAGTYPSLTKSQPAFYGMHAAQQLAAMGAPETESVRGMRGTFVPPYIHDARLQSRANQFHALNAIFEMRDKLDLRVSTSTSDSFKAKAATLQAVIESKLVDFAKVIGVPEELLADTKELKSVLYQALTDATNEQKPFATYDMRGLEMSRFDINDKIKALASDAADGALFSELGDIGPYVRTLMGSDLPKQATTHTVKMHEAAINDSLKTDYGYGSGLSDVMGQVMHSYGSFPYTSYISGVYENHHQSIVRYGDKKEVASMKAYIKEINDELTRRRRDHADAPSDANSQRIAALESMKQTAERVLYVRSALAVQLSKESNRRHGTHFDHGMPPGTGMSGAGGAYELGHSRTGWGMMTSALGLDGFATIMGVDKNGELPLGFRREPIALLEEVQSDVFQHVDFFGAYQDDKLFLPIDAKEIESMGRSSELAALVADHAKLLALSDKAEEGAIAQLKNIIGRAGRGMPSTGTRTFDRLSAKLFLDQTDLFQKSMMHEAMPALLKNTGRKVKVSDNIKASIARMTNGMVSPSEIFVFEFDHELIDLVRSFGEISRTSVDANVFEFIQQRALENVRGAKHADPSVPTHPRAAEMKAKMIRDLEAGNLTSVIREQLKISESIIHRGVEALRAQGYDALRNEVRSMDTMGIRGSTYNFVKALDKLGSNSSEIGNIVASHVARAMVKDEQLAMQMAAYIDGTGAVDYEGLVDRTIERIRKDYGDSKSYIGKAVLVILDEMKRMPSEARPHSTANTGFANVKTASNNPYADRFHNAAIAIDRTLSDAEISDIASNLPPIKDANGDVVYARVDGKGFVIGNSGNTFRTFKDQMDFVTFIRDARKSGATSDDITIMVAPYHRHAGTAAGDFAKNVVEVFSAMSGGPKFLQMAEAKQAEITSLRKEVKETFSPSDSGSVKTPKGDKTIYPEAIPFVRDGFYKSTQLMLNVLDSMNHGMHGVGIMDATYQLQRGGGLAEPQGWLKIGGGKGWILSIEELFDDVRDGTKFVSGGLLAYEKKTGNPANGPDGPHGGFLHRLATMNIESELGTSADSIRFSHNGKEKNLHGHLQLALRELNLTAQSYFPTEWTAKFEKLINEMNDPFRSVMGRPHQYEGNKSIAIPQRSSGPDRIALKIGEQGGLFAVAGPSGESAGWGYITNYGLPSYALELIAPGSTSDWRANYSLDLFERPQINTDGSWLVLTDKSGRTIDKIDQSQATPRQLEAFRERFLQLSQYKGRNWMVGTFLKEFGPAGGYVDFGVVGPTSTFLDPRFSATPFGNNGIKSPFINIQPDDVLARIRAKYIDKGLLPVHVGEKSPGSSLPGMRNEGWNSGDMPAIAEEAMKQRGMISPEAQTRTGWSEVASTFKIAGNSTEESVEINPQGAMSTPMLYGAKANARDGGGPFFHAGLNDLNHIQGLVAMYFPRAALDPAAAAAYIMRMTNPLTTTLVHTPLTRTKEQDIQFRRRVMEGIPLMQITGANVAGGESISANGVKRLAYLMKQREMLPKIKQQDETP